MDHMLLGIAGGRYEAESGYGKLPFDLFLLEWWDYREISEHAFHQLEQLPEELQCVVEELNHSIQLTKLTKLYIDGGLAVRKKYVDLARLLRRQEPHPAPQLILPPFQISVLDPIFTIQERNLMVETVHNRPSRVIRTCYRNHPGDAARHQWLLDEYVKHTDKRYSDPDNVAPGLGASGHAPENLDDAARYDFGSDYEKIFSVCPDLCHGTGDGRAGYRPVTARQRLTALFEDHRCEGFYDIDHALSVAMTWLADASIINWMQVEDEAFFEGEPVLLVYYDECGRTCFTQRMGPGARWNTCTPALQHGGWFIGSWRDSLEPLCDQAMGAAYRENGVIGKKWLGAVKKEAERLRIAQGTV